MDDLIAFITARLDEDELKPRRSRLWMAPSKDHGPAAEHRATPRAGRWAAVQASGSVQRPARVLRESRRSTRA